MNKLKISIILIFVFLVLPVMTNGQTTGTWTWSSELEEGDEYEWEVTTYEIDGETVETPTEDIVGFPIVEGSEIVIELLDSPSSYNLFNNPDYNDIFSITVDGDSEAADTVISFIFPVELDSELVAANNGFEAIFGVDAISMDGDETVIDGGTLFGSDVEGEIRYETETGILQLFDITDGTEKLVIELNSGFFSFLPTPSVWIFFIPLLAIPLFRKFIK